jgi:hypothetical protein
MIRIGSNRSATESAKTSSRIRLAVLDRDICLRLTLQSAIESQPGLALVGCFGIAAK